MELFKKWFYFKSKWCGFTKTKCFFLKLYQKDYSDLNITFVYSLSKHKHGHKDQYYHHKFPFKTCFLTIFSHIDFSVGYLNSTVNHESFYKWQ